MAANNNNKKVEPKVEEKEIVSNEVVSDEVVSEVVDENVVFTEEYQLKVHEYKVFNLIGEATKFVVESLGGGDLYADIKVIEQSVDTRITEGEPKVFEIDEEDRAKAFLYLTSASRPSFRITLLK